MWTDIDFKDQPERVAGEALNRFPLEPSAVVESGGGLHLHWFLKNPLDPQVEGKRVEVVLRRLAERLGGDRNACDVSRVLRLPGTQNFKYTPSRECRVRELYADRRYDFIELEGLFPSGPPHALGDTKTITGVKGGVPQGKRNATLARLAGKKFGEGWSPQDVPLWALGWNRLQCNPPLPENEVFATVESIRKTHGRNHPSSGTSYGDFSELPSVWDQKAELEWLVDGLIASRSVTIIAAESGTGKTWLALAIAGAVAHGQAFAGRSVSQQKVLYLDNENPLFTVKERLSELGIERTPDLKVWGWLGGRPGSWSPESLHRPVCERASRSGHRRSTCGLSHWLGTGCYRYPHFHAVSTKRVRVGAGGGFPFCLLQPLDQAPRFARHDDELTSRLFIGLHRLPAIKAGIGPRQDFLHAARQSPESALEMSGDLAARGPVAAAQPAHQIFARLGQEGQYRLVAALTLVLGVVALAPAHLAAVERVHGGVGVQRHRLQLHLGRGPDSFPQLALNGEDLLCHVEVQRGQKAPQRGLRRQPRHLQDAGQYGVAGDEAELVEPRKADIAALLSRWRVTRISSTSPSWSTALQR